MGCTPASHVPPQEPRRCRATGALAGARSRRPPRSIRRSRRITALRWQSKAAASSVRNATPARATRAIPTASGAGSPRSWRWRGIVPRKAVGSRSLSTIRSDGLGPPRGGPPGRGGCHAGRLRLSRSPRVVSAGTVRPRPAGARTSASRPEPRRRGRASQRASLGEVHVRGAAHRCAASPRPAPTPSPS